MGKNWNSKGYWRKRTSYVNGGKVVMYPTLKSRGAHIPGTWSSTRINFVRWRLIFSAWLVTFLSWPTKMCISAMCNSSAGHVPLQNRQLICIKMDVALLSPRIWRWLLDIWKICGSPLPKWAFYYSPTSSIKFGRWSEDLPGIGLK